MPTSDFAERILRFVGAKGYSPQLLEEIAIALAIDVDDQGDFSDACKLLRKEGRIVLAARGLLTLPPPRPRLIGEYRANLRGFGFVIPEERNAHGDLYIPRGGSSGAMTGDRVVVSVKKKGKRQGVTVYDARVVEILERGQNRFVGELRDNAGKLSVIPDGTTFHAPILVPDARAKNASPGQKVVVEVTQFPKDNRPARGVIVKVLGDLGQPGIETLGIIEQYQLPTAFPPLVETAAAKVATAFDVEKELLHRDDLRGETILTIDPTDARDFDDAISIKTLARDCVELGIHIADVAHFVCEDGPIDEEAKKRTTSVYLPRTVIPMLPEVLSNGVCSLQEREARLTKSAFITYDSHGNVKETRLANTVIKSTKRLTYDQVTQVLGGKPGRTSAKVVALIKEMDKLARRIRKRRLKDGMLQLEIPDAELVFDKQGHAVDVVPADTSFSHTIIEMFMVEANEAVSRTLTELKVPHLRRIHDAPPELADGSLQKLLRMLGYDLESGADRFALQALLDSVRGKPEAYPLHFAVLRSMRQAEYSPLLVGHFALASEHYCHFTSPIRRYPDLTIHRLVDLYARGELKREQKRKHVPSVEELTELGSQCSANERRAESAERELRTILTLQLLADRVGDEFKGIVTGVAKMGVFVQLDKYLIDGLVRFESLPDDWWELASGGGAVFGERSGIRIAIGDRLQVVLAKVDVRTRQLDLSLVMSSIVSPDGARGKGNRDRGKRDGRQRTRRASRGKARRRR
jgi:ribonuclease R